MRREDNPAKPQRDVTRPRSHSGQAWVCGYSDLGQCCQSGPTCDGRCGRTVLDSHAAASDAAGSEGSAGPQAVDLPPCIPRRSLAVRRQSLRLNLAILTGGLLMLCMTLPSREKTFVPGELSSTHAQILDNTLQSQRCGLCHPTSHAESSIASGNQVISGLLSSAKRLIENDGRQDQLCMQCHQGHLPAAVNRDPHDLTPEMWEQLRKSSDTPWQLVSTGVALQGSSGGSLPSESSQSLSKTSCAMCHNEHHGRGFDIKLISDSRCQACHQRQFESLASGHPEFKDFPMDRPRGLAFSHDQHARDHFPKKNRDFDCKTCHVSTGQAVSTDLVTRSLSFEHACASCHDQPIRAATVDGWAAIQLPSIESQDVANESAFADWPAGARYGYDGVVSPIMRALLMADPAATSGLDKLPASGKIVDVSSISSARAQVAKTLALATRRLMEETARDGQAAWVARLQKVTQSHLQRELTESDQALIAAMAAGLPPDLFRHVDSEWMGNRVPLAQRDSKPVRGRLARHTADQKSDDDLLLPTKSNDELLGTDDLLGEPAKSDAAADLLLGPTDDAVKKPVSKIVKGATHLAGGGWYADQTTLAIRYMPTGHADTTLSAWAMWWSLIESHKSVLPSSQAERIAGRMNLATSTNPAEQILRLADTIPGKCTECHQFDRIAARFVSSQSAVRLSDHFRVPERDLSVREFTKFQHTAHLTLPALADCRYCHQEKSSQPILSSALIAGHHPTMSEFATMKVSQCAACHRPGGANDRCVQCHNYHVSGTK